MNAPREDKNEIIDVATLWKGPQKVLVGKGIEAVWTWLPFKERFEFGATAHHSWTHSALF